MFFLPRSSVVYSKGCYDTRGHWVSRAREGVCLCAGAVKLSLTPAEGLARLRHCALISPISERLTQADDGRPLHNCTTAVKQGLTTTTTTKTRPVSGWLISECVSLIISESSAGGKHTHTHTHELSTKSGVLTSCAVIANRRWRRGG